MIQKHIINSTLKNYDDYMLVIRWLTHTCLYSIFLIESNILPFIYLFIYFKSPCYLLPFSFFIYFFDK